MITGGLIAWDANRADEALAMYRNLTESAPRELTACLLIVDAPPAPFVPEEWHGKLVVAMIVCYTGQNAERDLASIRAMGNPVIDLIGEMPYVQQQSLINDMDPKGLNQYWKVEYLSSLSDDFTSAFRDVAKRKVGDMTYSILFHIGGALNERAEDDGAVGNRDARYIAGYSAIWLPGEQGDAPIAWAREAWDAIRRFGTGGYYVNFQQNEDRTFEAYRSNYPRLQAIKARYDSANLFRVNRNISPAD